ncbi:hypothetical protein SBOR_4758 [Sclerotinia borealis F-4128]|uniref:Myb-like domain-containing protein n=1 Tax=Sclerotinia borealis (strain F-4128) TaxID=1432307 RepID=W9CDR0_SCLBF|nr:hypothetical protein SBOR_4758 [Sclerotinia borealis F-4128]
MDNTTNLPTQANMDDPGMETDPNSLQNIKILPLNSSIPVLQPENPTSGRTTTAIHLDIDPSQYIIFRNMLSKTCKNLGLRMEVDYATMSDIARIQVGVIKKRPANIAADDSIRSRTRSGGKTSNSTSYKENDERIDGFEKSDSEHVDMDHADPEHGISEPSTSEPGTTELDSSTTPVSLDKVRKVDTMFTKTELIALGVAYSVVPSWPLVAEYFPHRTQRSLYQTFKHTFTHSGNGHELARDSFPPGADIPELRKKFKTLRKLGSRTRRVLAEDLPKEYGRDIIRGHLSLSRWQKNNRKLSENGELTFEARPLSSRQEREQALQEEWEDEDDDSDFEDIRTAGAAMVKEENASQPTIIKADPDQTDQSRLSNIQKSSIIDLEASTRFSESSPDANIRNPSDSTKLQSKSALEISKSHLIEQLSQCQNEEELCRVLVKGLEIAKEDPDEPCRKRKPGRPTKRKRGSSDLT